MLAIRKHTRTTISKWRGAAVYSFRVEGATYVNKTESQTLNILHTYCGALRTRLATFYNWHQELAEIKSDSFGMVGISDFFAGASLPPFRIWDGIGPLLIRTDSNIVQHDIRAAMTNLNAASMIMERNRKLLYDYSDKNQKGYDTTLSVLKGVQTSASMGVAIVSSYVATPAGGAAITEGYEGFTHIVQQGIEVHLKMRDKIDFANIGIETAVNTLKDIVAGKIAEKILAGIDTQRLLTSLPPETQAKIYALLAKAPDKVKSKIMETIVGDMLIPLNECIKSVLKRYIGTEKELSWKKIGDNIAEEFTTDNILKEILTSAASK